MYMCIYKSKQEQGSWKARKQNEQLQDSPIGLKKINLKIIICTSDTYV